MLWGSASGWGSAAATTQNPRLLQAQVTQVHRVLHVITHVAAIDPTHPQQATHRTREPTLHRLDVRIATVAEGGDQSPLLGNVKWREPKRPWSTTIQRPPSGRNQAMRMKPSRSLEDAARPDLDGPEPAAAFRPQAVPIPAV